MQITILGRIPSKKNSRIQIKVRGRVINIPSKEYRAWHDDAATQLIRTPKRMLERCDRIELRFWFPDNRVTDLTNKAESVQDLLVDVGVLKNDCWQMTGAVLLYPMGVDKVNPRCEVLIPEVENELQAL
jgi:hypothetical protein